MEAGRDRHQFTGIDHVERAQLVAGIGRDRDPHLLDVLRAPLRRHDDLAQ
jgi:hypothetical protein